MSFAVLNIPICPLRKEPDDRSEMVSQILFGEYFLITDIYSNWVNIRLLNDGYYGWIDRKSFMLLDEKEKNISKIIVGDLIGEVFTKEEKFYVPMGSELSDLENGKFYFGNKEFGFKGAIAPKVFDEDKFIKTAKSFLKAPYLWGGKSLFGIDCSGFTQVVFGQYGFQLNRDAYQQAEQGFLVDFLTETKVGDLAFFDNEDGTITHVGIVLNDQMIIHAHGEVRIDFLDDIGIFNKETGKHTHRIRLIKRYF